MMKLYKMTKTGETALGKTHAFEGPGIHEFNTVHFLQPLNDWAREITSKESEVGNFDAEKVVIMLNKAYEAGRKSMQAEIRVLLGVHGTR